jgi:hypothetical protein
MKSNNTLCTNWRDGVAVAVGVLQLAAATAAAVEEDDAGR